MRARTGALQGALLIGIAMTAATALADLGPAKTLAGGLANPRGIDFAPNGALYVVEAGSGGPGPCVPSPVPPNLPRCYGETGALARIAPWGSVKRVVTGLPSLALPNGTVEGGPTDVSFFGMTAYVVLGLGGNPQLRPGLGGKASMLGTLLRVSPSGEYRVVADIAAQEAAQNPDGAFVDSNPYGVLALPGRRIVADAGANAIWEARPDGTVQLFAQPSLPDGRQTVPTSVTEGPGSNVYAGLLTGGPFFKGTSPVLQISLDGSMIEDYATGYTAVVDVTFDRGGALYVLEVASGFPTGTPPTPGLGIGRLLRQCPDGTRSELLAGLTFPGGVAIGWDGAAYITNFGTSPTAGEVLRLPLTPCDCKRRRH